MGPKNQLSYDDGYMFVRYALQHGLFPERHAMAARDFIMYANEGAFHQDTLAMCFSALADEYPKEYEKYLFHLEAYDEYLDRLKDSRSMDQ
jgi:hypothetical protein